MKHVLTSILLASALLVGTAQAAPFFSANDQDNCQFLAGMAHLTATNRNQYSKAEAQQVAFSAAADQNEVIDSDVLRDILSDVLHVIEIVYMYPHKSPSEEGNDIFRLCREE